MCFPSVQTLPKEPQEFELPLEISLVWLGEDIFWRKEVILQAIFSSSSCL